MPLLMRWPARIKAGTTTSQPGITMDLTATILAAAGGSGPASYRPEGIDLLPLLQKGTIVERTLFWRIGGPAARRRVRRGRMEVPATTASGPNDGSHEFLFDVARDPGERHDLVSSSRSIAEELRALLAKWEADVDATRVHGQQCRPSASRRRIHSSIQLEHAGKVIQIDPWSRGDSLEAEAGGSHPDHRRRQPSSRREGDRAAAQAGGAGCDCSQR